MKFKHGPTALLPFTARAYALLLLDLCDEAGRIEVGESDLVDVACFRLGATRSDRRLMRKMLPLLFESGYLFQMGRYVLVSGFAAAEADRLRAKARALHGDSVFARDGHRCVYCGATDDLTLDHVRPLTRGGSNEMTNLATACRGCNSSKSDRTPTEWRGRA